MRYLNDLGASQQSLLNGITAIFLMQLGAAFGALILGTVRGASYGFFIGTAAAWLLSKMKNLPKH